MPAAQDAVELRLVDEVARSGRRSAESELGGAPAGIVVARLGIVGERQDRCGRLKVGEIVEAEMAAVEIDVVGSEFRQRDVPGRRLIGEDHVAHLEDQVEVHGGGILERHVRRQRAAVRVADHAEVEAVGGAGLVGGLEAAFDHVAGGIDEAIEVLRARLEVVDLDLHRHRRIGHEHLLGLDDVVELWVGGDLQAQAPGLDRPRPQDGGLLGDVAGGNAVRKGGSKGDAVMAMSFRVEPGCASDLRQARDPTRRRPPGWGRRLRARA